MSEIKPFLNRETKRDKITEFLVPRRFDFKLFEEAIEDNLKELQKLSLDAHALSLSYAEKVGDFDGEGIEEVSAEDLDNIDKYTDAYIDYSIMEAQIQSLIEMQIGFYHKQFEIALKELSGLAYDMTNPKELFKWNFVKEFYKSKGILIGGLTGYPEVDKLKEVNNKIKHGGELDNKILSIPEFAGKDTLEYSDLLTF